MKIENKKNVKKKCQCKKICTHESNKEKEVSFQCGIGTVRNPVQSSCSYRFILFRFSSFFSFTSLPKIQGEFFFRGNEILIDNYVSSTELTKMVSEHFIDHVSILPDPNYF